MKQLLYYIIRCFNSICVGKINRDVTDKPYTNFNLQLRKLKVETNLHACNYF